MASGAAEVGLVGLGSAGKLLVGAVADLGIPVLGFSAGGAGVLVTTTGRGAGVATGWTG